MCLNAVGRVKGHSSRSWPRGVDWNFRRRLYQIELAHEVRRNGNGPPVLSSALQGADSNFLGLEVDIACADGEGFRDSATRVREGKGEGLHVWALVLPDGLEEARAFFLGEVLPTAGVDQAEVDRWIGHGPSPATVD